jgi:hypothetical protein
MSRSVEETRRDFLVRLARTAAFVAPAVLTLDAAPLAAQGGGGGKAGKAAATSSSSVVGSLTPTSLQAPLLETQLQSDETVPWDPASGETAPWTVPPPTSTG